MKIKIIDFGYLNIPKRAHDNDAGMDVYAPISVLIRPGATVTIPLGFGLELPDGFAGFIFTRSSFARKGLACELPPIDSGYKGQIHAIITNHSVDNYQIKKGDRIGQLIIMPILLPELVEEFGAERGTGAFGSTGA